MICMTQQRCRLHDLAGLAIPTLGNLMLHPCGLHGVHGFGRSEPFNGCHIAVQIADAQLAGPHGLSINVHGAGATLGNAATIFDTGDAKFVSQHPQQRHVFFNIHLVGNSIDR